MVRNKFTIVLISSRHLLNFCCIALLLLIGGCGLISKASVTYHNLDYPSPPVEYSDPSPDTLMVYKFLSDPSVDTHLLTISDVKSNDSIVGQHRWQENPVDMITDLVLRDIETSRLFEKAVDQWSSMRYRYALEGTVRNLSGEIASKSAYANVEAEVSFIDFDAPKLGKKVIFKKSYRISEPSEVKTPAKIAEAMNRAVRKLSKNIRDDVSASMKLMKSSPGPTPAAEK